MGETPENRAWLARQLPASADIDLMLSLAGGAPFRAIQLADEGLLTIRLNGAMSYGYGDMFIELQLFSYLDCINVELLTCNGCHHHFMVVLEQFTFR